MKFYIVFFISLLMLGSSCKVAQTTRIYVVRHADRTPPPEDALITAGVTRANELSRVLFNAGVDSIFSTNTVRTRGTVQPLATAKGLPVILYSNNTDLLARILRNSKGKTVLVSGHSDTAPGFITACGCTAPYTLIPSTQFDNLYLIILQKETVNNSVSTSCKLLHMKYGAITN